jgi:hypothetical protein
METILPRYSLVIGAVHCIFNCRSQTLREVAAKKFRFDVRA